MTIVGGLDIHRKQITFDWVDLGTGEQHRGKIEPADRAHVADWVQQFAGRTGVELAFEGCTGWRYVAEELATAGVVAHLAEPAETAARRGRKRHAKTDRADCRHLRQLLIDERLPECWIPPGHVLEGRALLGTYRDLLAGHTAWVQRIHAVLFHQGARRLCGQGGLGSPRRRVELAQLAAAQLSPVGQLQVVTASRILDGLQAELDLVHHEVVHAAGHLCGARELQARLYGVGPRTALALTCWLGGAGRFTSCRQAVRFTGLDITVHSSDGKRTRGRLSRQGPPVLRWFLFEAGKAHARGTAADHGYYAAVKDRLDGKRAALSEARKIVREAYHVLTELGDDALTIT